MREGARRPGGDAATEEVAILGPDACAERQGERNGRPAARIARDPPAGFGFIRKIDRHGHHGDILIDRCSRVSKCVLLLSQGHGSVPGEVFYAFWQLMPGLVQGVFGNEEIEFGVGKAHAPRSSQDFSDEHAGIGDKTQRYISLDNHR